MSLFKRAPRKPERTGPDLQPAAAPYRHVRTAQGRTAHLQQAPPGVLCGWRGPWVPADPLLPVCRMCEDAAEAAGTARAS